MIDDFDWSGLGALLLGSGLGYAANQSATNRQKQLTDAMTQYRLGKAREGEAATMRYIEAQKPEARTAENLNIRNELLDGLKESVGATQAFQRPDGGSGAQSGRYREKLATGNAAVEQRLAKALQDLATIGTPGEAQMVNARRFNSAAGDLNAANRAAASVGDTYMRAINTAKPDPFLSLAAQFARGIGLGNLDKRRPIKLTTGGHAQNLGFAQDALPQE